MSAYFEPSIPEFFSGKTLFITGATGFLGKALTEKFLRSCPDIGNIYILVRPKRGKNIQERVQTLANDPIFERVKREQPNLVIEEKVIAVAGDCRELNLGLSPEARNTLIEKVNIIFHVAASVRFDDPLTDAIIMNTRGTREVCQLALDVKNILAYIYVSTTFVNSNRTESKEIIYPPEQDWKNAIEIAEKMNPFDLNVVAPKIIGDLPNTYTFTKNIAEHVVEDMLGGKIPCRIYRPSIVIGTLHEPVKGWIDNLNGPVGVLVAYGLGILRTTYFSTHSSQDYIPVDVVVKSLIVSAWDTAVRSSSSNNVLPMEVINGSACDIKWLRIDPIGWRDLCLEANSIVPLNDIIWIPNGHTTKNVFVWYIRTVCTMVLPSILIDQLLKLKGKKPRLIKIQKTLFTVQMALSSIISKEYRFCNANLLTLRNRIQEKDKPSFDYNFENYDTNEYVFNMLMGARRYILNSPDSTIESAKRHYNKIWWIQKVLNTISLIMFFLFMYFIIT